MDQQLYEKCKKLTPEQRTHVALVIGAETIDDLQLTFTWQKDRRDNGAKTEPCWECRQIARILGYEV
jgi:hypothetical protein